MKLCNILIASVFLAFGNQVYADVVLTVNPSPDRIIHEVGGLGGAPFLGGGSGGDEAREADMRN